MTPQQAKELLPIITAFAEGKQIQCTNISDTGWLNLDKNPVFCLSPDQYRIKPEPFILKYRRFIWKNHTGWHISAFSSDLGFSSIDIENEYGEDFVRWIDNDWVEYECEI